MTGPVIRPESAGDADDIRAINVAAFAGHPYSQQTEHLIVDALRESGALAISLVADLDGRPVGHIAFSEAAVGDAPRGWFLLGPVAVLPEHQRESIGSALVESGLAELRASGAAGCVLVGDPHFYRRFGFGTHPGLVYEGVPGEFVLGLAFGDEAPAGAIRANEAFEVRP